MNDEMHEYDRFLFSLVTEFTRRALPQIRSLWADLMELEEASDPHALRVARAQTLRRLQILRQAARAVDAAQVQSLSQTLAQSVVTVPDERNAHRQELFEFLYQTMRELTEALYVIQAVPSAMGQNGHPTESELVDSYAN